MWISEQRTVAVDGTSVKLARNFVRQFGSRTLRVDGAFLLALSVPELGSDSLQRAPERQGGVAVPGVNVRAQTLFIGAQYGAVSHLWVTDSGLVSLVVYRSLFIQLPTRFCVTT